MKVSNETLARTGQDPQTGSDWQISKFKRAAHRLQFTQPHIIYFLENCFQRIYQNDENTAREDSGPGPYSTVTGPEGTSHITSLHVSLLSSLHITYRS